MYKNEAELLSIIFLLFLIIIQSLNFFSLNPLYDFSYTIHDLKWSGSNLFIQDENIYQIYFNNPADSKIIGSQFPNYSIGSIYFHLPLGFLTLGQAGAAWIFFSSLLTFHIYIILQNLDLKIKNKELVLFLLMILLILSKPFNLVISNGNFSIVSFWAFTFFFLGKKNNIFISLFLSSIKYSFAPVIFLYSFLKKDFIQIFFVFIFTGFLLINYSLKFNYDFIELIFAPILIGNSSTASGFLDFQTLLGNHPQNIFLRYSLILLTAIFLFYIIYKNTDRSKLFDLCLVSFVTLLIFKHLYYDLIFLLPILLYSFKLKLNKRLPIIIIIFYYWFISYNEIFEFLKYSKIFMLFNNILLVVCFVLILDITKKIHKLIS